MKLLVDALHQGAFLPSLEAPDMASIVRQGVNFAVAHGFLPPEKRTAAISALLEREREASTAIGHGVAVPHCFLEGLERTILLLVRLADPLNLGAPDGIPVRFVFILLGPPDSAAEHLEAMAGIARLMADDEFRYEAGEARTTEELLEALRRYRERLSPPVSPTTKPPTEGLKPTGRLFGGLIADIKRRLPHYLDDFRDGFHPKCLSSTLFLFFACLAPAVTFGGIMAELTENHIGAVEMLVATAFCGVVYALFSGQPLIILGGTGPLLLITAILYDLCKRYELDFFATYGWIGLWVGFFLFVMAATDASCLMRYFTRFTDEIFAGLIATIFIYKALSALATSFKDLETTQHHATAFLTLLLALGTLYIATNLSRFRRSRYLVPWMREFLADFGPTIALAAMTGVALYFSDVALKELPAPDRIEPTFVPPGSNESRPWLVNLSGVPGWVWIAAAGPAALAAILVFIDQNITARLVNSPDHKLTRGEAYHLDLAVVGVLIAVCSLFGLPWLVAATVRSLNHVRSLATAEEVVNPYGETSERILHVRENRVTGLGIHLLIGLSLFLLPVIKLVPMAVLYGIFLYMGIVSLGGNQFWERLNLWLMDSSLYPQTHYVRRVPRKVIHAFTLIQLICLILLWVTEFTPVAILFPLFIALLVPLRLLLDRFFAPEHLAVLDAEEAPEEESRW